MASASFVQPNFSAGEWSPSKHGRMDDQRYKDALALCLNYIPTLEGSLAPRSGFRYLGSTIGGAQAKLLPFRFSPAAAYVIEASNDIFRLWANGLLFLQDSINISSAANTGGHLVLTTSAPFPTLWTGYPVTPTVKVHFPDMDTMSMAPFLVGREFLLTITGASTATLADARTGAAVTDTIGGTFTGRLDLVLNIPAPATQTDTALLRVLPYTTQTLSQDAMFASAPEHKAAIFSPQYPPIAFSSVRGVARPFYEQFQDGPYFDSIGNDTIATVSGTTGDITVKLHAWVATVSYAKGDVVIDQGSYFVSLVDGNLNNATPLTTNAFWSVLFEAWDSGTTYAIGDVVNGSPVSAAGVSTIYYSQSATNLNHNPVTDNGTHWSTTPPAFDGAVGYEVGAVVLSGGINYVDINSFTNTGHTPASSPTWWLPINLEAAYQVVFNTTTGWFVQTFSDTDGSDTAAATNTTFGLAGRCFRMKAGPRVWNVARTYLTGDFVNFNDVIFKALAGNTGVSPDSDEATWEIQSKTIQWTWGRIKSVTSGFEAVVTLLGDDLQNTDPVWEYRFGVFSETTGWPKCATYHEGRVVLSGAQPNRIDFGQPDLGFSFAPTQKDGTVTDGNGVAITLNAEGNEHINDLASTVDGVIALTDMGEWTIAASNLADPITPTSAQAKRGTTFTSADAASQPLNSSTGFVQGNRRRLLEYKHFLDQSAYSIRPNAVDLTKDCQHLTVQGISHVAYQRVPHPVIWTNAGRTEPANSTNLYAHTLFGIGYSREPELQYTAPFSIEHGADAEFGTRQFRFLAVQYGANETQEYLYYMGFEDPTQTTGIMEMLEPVLDMSSFDHSRTFANPALTDAQKLIACGCFLDSAVEPAGFKGNADQTGVVFYGLYYHRNKTVSFCINGKYIGDYTIGTDGTVEVPFSNGVSTSGDESGAFSIWDCYSALAATISQSALPDTYQEVVWDNNGNDFGPAGLETSVTRFCASFGYKYKRRGKLLRPTVAGNQNGPMFAKIVRNQRMGVYVDSAHEISIGSSFSDLSPLTLTLDGVTDTTALGVADVTTGIFRDNVKSDYDFDGQLCWEQTEPYSGSVLAVGGFDVVTDV